MDERGMDTTDELRRLLDKRGVEHYDGTETTLWGYEPTSESTGVYRIAADEISGGRMQVRMFNVTPAQAIDATLGRGECRLIRRGNLSDWPEMVCWSCSECGFGWHHSVNDSQFSYCPNCGARVVE